MHCVQRSCSAAIYLIGRQSRQSNSTVVKIFSANRYSDLHRTRNQTISIRDPLTAVAHGQKFHDIQVTGIERVELEDLSSMAPDLPDANVYPRFLAGSIQCPP